MCVTLRGVAQVDSALAWGARGRWFDPSRPDQKLNLFLTARKEGQYEKNLRVYRETPTPALYSNSEEERVLLPIGKL